MLDKKIRILNFDDAVTKQERIISRYEAEVIDLRDIGPRARFWMNRRDRSELERRIASDEAGSITFLGSGDFHHVTETLIRQHNEPLSIIDFDFHPDWDTISPWLHCGSWVAEAMKNPNVLKLIMIGASSKGLSPFSIQSGDLDSLKNDRIEMYPYSCKRATVFFRKVPPNMSLETKKNIFSTKIYWNELKKKNITEFFLHLIRRLPTKKVYVTIDKDCLGTEDALTNWDQGILPLDDLLVMLKMIKDNLDIMGMDIVGDYSAINIDGVFKNMVSWLDRPKSIKASEISESSVCEVNERTNLKILELMSS